MIVFGLMLGRWWRTALVLGAVGWAAVLFADDVITAMQIPGAAAFGLVNTGVGVAVHQGGLWLFRRLRGGHTPRRLPTSVG